MNRCESCPRLTTGRFCVACRVRKCRGTTIDGSCPLCGVSDRRMLRRHRFTDGTRVICANHAAVAGRRSLDWRAFLAELGDAQHILPELAKKTA
jgi:hypothetical protein